MDDQYFPLTNGGETVVSGQDADLARFPWARTSSGRYACCKVKGEELLLHRVILGRVLGRALVRGEEVDHRNGKGLDNRRANLRLATHQQNMQNRKLACTNTSGFRGVSFRRNRKKWQAGIQVDGKTIHLGTFPTPEAASAAYERAAEHYFGSWRRDA